MSYDLYYTVYKGKSFIIEETKHDSFEGRPYTVKNVYKLTETTKDDLGVTIYHYQLDRSEMCN